MVGCSVGCLEGLLVGWRVGCLEGVGGSSENKVFNDG